MTTPHDSYAWNYRELATFLISNENLTEGGFEPLTKESMRGILPLSYPYAYHYYLRSGVDNSGMITSPLCLAVGIEANSFPFSMTLSINPTVNELPKQNAILPQCRGFRKLILSKWCSPTSYQIWYLNPTGFHDKD